MNELLNDLILESNEYEDNDVVTEEKIGNDDHTSLVNSTTADNINPGDIRKFYPFIN